MRFSRKAVAAPCFSLTSLRSLHSHSPVNLDAHFLDLSIALNCPSLTQPPSLYNQPFRRPESSTVSHHPIHQPLSLSSFCSYPPHRRQPVCAARAQHGSVKLCQTTRCVAVNGARCTQPRRQSLTQSGISRCSSTSSTLVTTTRRTLVFECSTCGSTCSS